MLLLSLSYTTASIGLKSIYRKISESVRTLTQCLQLRGQKIGDGGDSGNGGAAPSGNGIAEKPVLLASRGFDISKYSFESFKQDASTLTPYFPDESCLLSAKEANKLKPWDTAPKIKEQIVAFDIALEKFGLGKSMRDTVLPSFKIATESLGLKCDKRSVDELRRWIARALQAKYEEQMD